MDQCDFPRCRNQANITYIGTGICDKHWKQLCIANSKTEKRLMAKIGLKRDKDGKVVPII